MKPDQKIPSETSTYAPSVIDPSIQDIGYSIALLHLDRKGTSIQPLKAGEFMNCRAGGTRWQTNGMSILGECEKLR